MCPTPIDAGRSQGKLAASLAGCDKGGGRASGSAAALFEPSARVKRSVLGRSRGGGFHFRDSLPSHPGAFGNVLHRINWVTAFVVSHPILPGIEGRISAPVVRPVAA